jgi:hypothetical protein
VVELESRAMFTREWTLRTAASSYEETVVAGLHLQAAASNPAQAGERRRVGGARRRTRHKLASGDGGLLQGDCRLLLLQEGACGPGTAACSNRLLLCFLGVLDEGVEFGFEGGGDDVSRCSTHAGAEVEDLATAIR